MKASLLFLLALTATLMISEFIVCDVNFGAGKRNGETFKTIQVTDKLLELELIPDKDGDIFTLQRKDLLDICSTVITMEFKDKSSTDLPSSINNLVATSRTNDIPSSGSYKMLVPKGMKYTGTVHVAAGGKLKIKTSEGNFFTFEVGLLSLLGQDKPVSLVAPSNIDELFTITLTSETSKCYLDGYLESTTSSDTPSRNVKEATPPDATGIAIGVIIGIIACCCLSCIAIAALVIYTTKRGNKGGPSGGITVVTTGATGTTVVNEMNSISNKKKTNKTIMINGFSNKDDQNIIEVAELVTLKMSKSSEEILFEDFNDQTNCSTYSSLSNNSNSTNTSEWGDVMDLEEELFNASEDFEYQVIKFEYPFNAEYEDIFNNQLEELIDEDEEGFEEAEEEEYNNNLYEEYFEEYEYNHCLGGMKFKHLANMKKVKQKFKRMRINPKRRIHHRELKKQQEEVIEKREKVSSKIYTPPPIRYADNNYSNNNNNRHHQHGSNSDEEAQLQQAISHSLTDHHVNDYARECGIEYNLLLALTQRELTAEDYDLLLQLDNTVKKKTVSENILDSLPCCTLNHFGEVCQSDMPQITEGDMCITCMCDFEEGDEVRWITKCAHIFHKNCIDNWLNNHSTCCPICRVEVNS
ncbi:predicted protein [Naegleria gruberi]|uniref:Predicted protein n=1 Tax=Naegleria gruberi TaxID=5762 RepID=D2V595_NAEGR|nr:uncharacterized protein NAEGRDRAFT_46814 [Naegleria gruberi]EFC48235.1 predicted protein [Naegleria gruberi]|eukprot:XP_002680979.1 predicted protein [Naegleria gruberi strain NEG-M]